MSQQQQQQISLQFTLQSKVDNQRFSVDEKVVEASTLLKNICEITDIAEPIIINCPGQSMEFFISLINDYQATSEEENKDDKKSEKILFDTFTEKNKENLIKLIQDLCILDSDYFFNSAADYILGILGEVKRGKSMDWNGIRKYLGLESDFTAKERQLILDADKLEYLLSINTKNFTFPFPNKNLYSLKTDFSTPMNILMARIIQRSNASISYLLSLINKTIKNEIDRHPIKLSEFCEFPNGWNLATEKCGFHSFLGSKKYDEIYFNVLKKRKVIADEKFEIFYNEHVSELSIQECGSSRFPISKKVLIRFSDTYKSMYKFDVTKIYSSSIYYEFFSFDEYSKIEFKEVYDHLIAKDLSKKIKIRFGDKAFNFFRPWRSLRFYKKENASKFCKLEIMGMTKIEKLNPEFKKFLTDYMEEDGIIKSSKLMPGIPIQKPKDVFYQYPVSIVKESLKY